MNRISTILTIATLLVTSCNQKSNIHIKDEIGKLNKLLENIDESSQFYIICPDSIVTITGKYGTRFIINPSDLMTQGGGEINDSIKIELKELTNQYQMAMANAQTISKNRLLVSGGAYFIEITTQGEKVILKPKKKIKIRFPILSQENMSLFSGNRDSLGRLFWTQENISLKNERYILLKELEMLQVQLENVMFGNRGIVGYGPKTKLLKNKMDSLRSIIYGDILHPEIDFGNLEWINIDRFLEIKNKTNLMVNFLPSDKIKSANIYLIFKDINSVVQEYYFDENKKNANITFQNIPVGANVKIIAYTLKDNKIFAHCTSMKIKENETVTLPMNELNEKDFKNLFKSL